MRWERLIRLTCARSLGRDVRLPPADAVEQADIDPNGAVERLRNYGRFE
jgi:hypothetical protein